MPMIIQAKHREIEKSQIKSGSTFKGCGAAYCDKIMRKPDVILAKDYFEKACEETNVPVTIIGTGKGNEDIIDIRNV